ncbi:MAG: hypothetical protein M1836_007300 [Candelina mexicana]|nr:MAG: hypothetical protein M1836_007300 [Candelina mexicana]
MAPSRLSGNATPPASDDWEESSRLDLSNEYIFGDEFALDPLDVPDSFVSALEETENPFADDLRPAEATSNLTSTTDGSTRFTSPDVDVDESSNGSTAKTERAFRAEESDTTSARTPPRPLSISTASLASDTERRPHRSISSASTFLAPRPSSPYRGVTGPSHPYGMYPQSIGVFRNASVATTSIDMGQGRSSFVGHRGPAHPYAMYPQNIIGEPVLSETEFLPPMPVGFLGLGQRYQRRLGSDGEEAQDIIGPDGHTEQLPAYSRYPDALPAKEPPPSHVGGDIAGAPVPTNDLRQEPVFSERHEAIPRDQSSSSTALLQSSTAEVHGHNASLSEDSSGSFKEKWAERGRKRVCCGMVPLWAMAVFVATIMVAAVVGGVIGGSIASSDGRRKAQQNAAVAIVSASVTITRTASTMTQIDASPLASLPSNLPPLPCGTYAVTIGMPEESSNACLTDLAQVNAWDCGIPDGNLQLQVNQGQGHAGTELKLMLSEEAEDAPITYGAQPPVISQPQQLSMYEDLEDHDRGPAWFFQQAYDKVVIVRQEDFAAGRLLDQAPSNPFATKRRGDSAIDDGLTTDFHRRNRGGIAQPGEQPWYCFWNHTLLEGFIYVTQNVSAASSSPSSAPSTTSLSIPYKPHRTSSAPTNTAPIPAYPKQVKVGELRTKPNTPDYIAPYCQQMQVLNDGTVGLVINTATQGPNIVPLNETMPAYQKGRNGGRSSGRRERSVPGISSTGQTTRVMKRDFYTDSCHCEWMDKVL